MQLICLQPLSCWSSSASAPHTHLEHSQIPCFSVKPQMIRDPTGSSHMPPMSHVPPMFPMSPVFPVSHERTLPVASQDLSLLKDLMAAVSLVLFSSPGFHLLGCNLLHQLTATFAERQFWFSLFGQLGLANIKQGNLLEAQGGDNYLSPLERGLTNQLYGYYRGDSALKNPP